MAFRDDAVDAITAEISHIGLGTGPSTEVSGNGYTHQVPSYVSASDGAADLEDPLEFDGPVNGEVTHILFKRDGEIEAARSISGASSFNSDGRYRVTSAEVTVDYD